MIKLFSLKAASKPFFVSRKEQNLFRENWQEDKVELATSLWGILASFLFLQLIKSPKDFHDELINRFTGKKNSAGSRAFLTRLSEALYQYLGRSGQTENLFRSLTKTDLPTIFLIDEFFSLNSVSIKKLKNLGRVIYISSDLASDFYGDNYIASRLMYKLEKHAIGLPDLVVACSERDRLKYVQMGAKKALFYPNIYPIEFEFGDKDECLSVAIVLRGHWGQKSWRSLEKVLSALACIGKPVKVYMIGVKPKKSVKQINLIHFDFIPTREEYMKTLSKAWIGINLGIHAGGSNQRKYDYAMAGLVVFSDGFGSRGDFIPNEYAYVDEFDLLAKIKELLSLDKEKIFEMGQRNRSQALSFAKEKRDELSSEIMAM